MNEVDVSPMVLKKRINEIDATCGGDIDAHMALCRILGVITGYVPGNRNISENDQIHILNRVLEILNKCKK